MKSTLNNAINKTMNKEVNKTMDKEIRIARIKYASGFIILLVIEILIALYIHDDIIRPYLGDVLVVMVLYCFVRIFLINGGKLIPLYIFIFAAGMEVLQYFRLIELLRLQNITFFRVLIGSVFDIKDIICYGIGCIITVVLTGVCKKGKQ
jgi:hypothetical protein